MNDLLVAGDAVVDVIVGELEAAPELGQAEILVDTGVLTVGGSSAIMACGAARLGLRVAFVGVVGDDSLGRYLLEQLEARGVDVSACIVRPGAATGVTVNLVQGGAEHDRALITAVGCVGELEPEMLSPVLQRGVRHLHVGSFYLLPRLAPSLGGVFAAARAAGATCSLDTQSDPQGRWRGGLREALAETDVYLPNQSEAEAVAAALGAGGADLAPAGEGAGSDLARADGGAGPDLAPAGAPAGGEAGLVRVLETLAALGPLPVVKRGPHGAASLDDGRVVTAPALDVGAVDVIGAGDTFDAGFVYGLLAGWPVRESLAFAAACGSLSTRRVGGVDSQPTFAEASAALGWEGGAPASRG